MVTAALGTTPETTMIGVLGVKGGVGTTTVSVNLACALAQLRGLQVTLFDANVQQPDAACLLNRHPRFSILDLLSRQTLDDELLAACCETLALDGKGTLRLISPPADAGQALQIESRDVTNLLAALKAHSQPAAWVVDLPRNIDSHLVATLDLMTNIVLVLEATVPALAAARRWFEVFQDLGYGSERVVCVLNRSGGKMKEIESQLDSNLRGYPLLRLANAYEAAERACIEGLPLLQLAPRSAYTRDMQELARYLTSTVGVA
jgi:pilus assembly protein CpaE